MKAHAGNGKRKIIELLTPKRLLTLLVPVLAIGLSLLLLSRFAGRPGRPAGINEKSIAVLPFEIIGSGNGNIWLGDALTDEIISQLCKINDLEVRPRTSVMRYRATTISIPAIGRELGTNYIIEGNCQIFNEVVRITVKLINARKDQQLWSDVFEGTWDSLHGMQTDISDNAQYFLLAGNRFVDSISFTAAISMYDKAIAEDPGFALAYARRAIARSWGYYSGQLDDSHLLKCKADADRAFALDNNLPDARIALGFYNYYCMRDYREALSQFSRAAETDPADYQPPFYMAMVYRRMGEWQKSQDLLRKVMMEDPRDAIVLINIGTSFVFMHSFDTALVQFSKAINVMPEWPGPYINAIDACLLKDGNTTMAREMLDISGSS